MAFSEVASRIKLAFYCLCGAFIDVATKVKPVFLSLCGTFSAAATTTKLAFSGLFGVLLLFFISFITAYCISYHSIFTDNNAGLCPASNFNAAWVKATQAMECLALITGITSVGLLGLCWFVDRLDRNLSILMLTKIAPMAMGSLSMLGVIIFGAKVTGGSVLISAVDLLCWSFSLCAVSIIVFLTFGDIGLVTRHQT